MTLNLKCPCCGYTETVNDERAVWLVCPKCQTVVERQKPTLWLNPVVDEAQALPYMESCWKELGRDRGADSREGEGDA